MSEPICQCGCGEPTGWATRRRVDRGIEVGDALRFKVGHKLRVPMSDRFAGGYEVNEATGCWIWTRSIGRNGYGIIRDRRKQLLAHRVSYCIAIGPIAAEHELDHLCRVRRCVNPAHLEPVSHTTNVRRGANTLLTLDQAVEVQRLRGSASATAVGVTFGVSRDAIKSIWRGRTWKESAELAASWAIDRPRDEEQPC